MAYPLYLQKKGGCILLAVLGTGRHQNPTLFLQGIADAHSEFRDWRAIHASQEPSHIRGDFCDLNGDPVCEQRVRSHGKGSA